jgi:hypothetical protein
MDVLQPVTTAVEDRENADFDKGFLLEAGRPT